MNELGIGEQARIKRISSNNVRARQARQEGDPARELQVLLWAQADITQLIIAWNVGEGGIDDGTAMLYAESGSHTVARVRELVHAKVKPRDD